MRPTSRAKCLPDPQQQQQQQVTSRRSSGSLGYLAAVRAPLARPYRSPEKNNPSHHNTSRWCYCTFLKRKGFCLECVDTKVTNEPEQLHNPKQSQNLMYSKARPHLATFLGNRLGCEIPRGRFSLSNDQRYQHCSLYYSTTQHAQIFFLYHTKFFSNMCWQHACSPFDHSHKGTQHCSLKFFCLGKQHNFKMTGKICRQTGLYGRIPQSRSWFVPNCEWSIAL